MPVAASDDFQPTRFSIQNSAVLIAKSYIAASAAAVAAVLFLSAIQRVAELIYAAAALVLLVNYPALGPDVFLAAQ